MRGCIVHRMLLPRLTGLLAKLPAVSLRIMNLSSTEIAGGLADGTLDLGIVRAGAVPGRIKTAPLGNMQFALFIPLRLLGGKRPADFTPSMISRLPFAVLEGEGAFRLELGRLAKRAKVNLDFQIELSSFPLVAKAVQTGSCAAVLPELARGEFSSAEVAEVRPDWLRPMSRELVLAWNPRLARIRTALGGAVAGFRTVAWFG